MANLYLKGEKLITDKDLEITTSIVNNSNFIAGSITPHSYGHQYSTNDLQNRVRTEPINISGRKVVKLTISAITRVKCNIAYYLLNHVEENSDGAIVKDSNGFMDVNSVTIPIPNNVNYIILVAKADTDFALNDINKLFTVEATAVTNVIDYVKKQIGGGK